MVSRPRGNSALRPVLLLLAGMASLSGFIAVTLTSENLSSGLWPVDVHQFICSLFGSTATWSSVLVRIAAFVCVLLTVSRMTQGREVTLRLVQQLGRAWLMSLIWLALWLTYPFVAGGFLLTLLELTSPFWVAVFLGTTFNAVLEVVLSGIPWKSTQSLAPESGQGSRRLLWPSVVLGLAMISWTAVSFWMNERLYAGLWIPHGDSGMYEEHLWNTWHGKGFRSYLDQGLFLGEHIQVIHLGLLPLHMLWPSHLMLELAESVSLAICAIPVYRITQRHSGSATAAVWLASAWLVYVPMHYLDIAIDLKTLRPSCYGLPFLFWGIDLAERMRWRPALICFLIGLTAQEDFALVTGSIGMSFWLIQRKAELSSESRKRSQRYAILLFLGSVVYLLLAVLVVIPAFRSGEVVHYSRYFGDLGNSPGDLVRTALSDPLRVLRQLIGWRMLYYVLALAVPAGFLMFRSPVRLAAATPTFVMLCLIQLGDGTTAEMVVPYHHFHAPLLPVLFWAAAAGLSANRSHGLISKILTSGFEDSTRAARFAFCCGVGVCLTSSLMPLGTAFWSEQSRTGYTKLFVPGPRAEHFVKVLEQLPVTARVASTDYVHTRLTHFERSYDYSEYPRAVNNYQPGVPDDTDYIVLDTQHPYSRIRTLNDIPELQSSQDEWEVVPDRTDGYFIILKRVRAKRAVAKPALRDGSDPETARPQ